MLYQSVTELIGNTPLVKLSGFTGLRADVYLKLEMFNPAGSVKDRVAAHMIEVAEADGRLDKGGAIIEATSGNTGIGLAAVAAAKGYRMILVMPESMSAERRKLALAYGAELVLTPAAEGMSGAVRRAEALERENDGFFYARQFENPANPETHRLSTGPEIERDLDGTPDLFVAGFGTGGTVSGVGGYLKSKNPRLRVVAAEPAASPLVTEGRAGAHAIQGLGANFVPANLNRAVVDEFVTVTDEDALRTTRELAAKTGLFCGISSGAALFAALREARKTENGGKKIVVLLPDTGERYLSTKLFD